jgi:hypothetical protein
MAISVKCPLIQGVKLVKHISNDSAESKINPYLSGSSFISLDLMVPILRCCRLVAVLLYQLS